MIPGGFCDNPCLEDGTDSLGGIDGGGILPDDAGGWKGPSLALGT